MKNQKYSLTAKERKDRNRKGNGSNPKDDASIREVDGEQPVVQGDGSAVAPKRRMNVVFLIISIFMVALLLTSIVVTILLINESEKPDGNPIATISLSNGKKLEFEIYENDVPFAATNFMFLSMKGYFNNTVIHDNQNNWIRFMGMVDYSTHKSSDENYCKNFTGFDKRGYEWGQDQDLVRNVFWYRLKKDNDAPVYADLTETQGLLCFQYSNTSSLFQISCENGANTRINTTNRATFTVFGKYLDQSTLTALKALDIYGTENATKKTPWYSPNEVIKINSIKISNYDKKKWEGILKNFDSYMDEIGGYSSHSTSVCSITT